MHDPPSKGNPRLSQQFPDILSVEKNLKVNYDISIVKDMDAVSKIIRKRLGETRTEVAYKHGFQQKISCQFPEISGVCFWKVL